jgi:hypothetical protein
VGFFAKKWDHFFWGGMPPVVAPEGDLVFWGKLSCTFYWIADVYICAANWGVGLCDLQQEELGNPS